MRAASGAGGASGAAGFPWDEAMAAGMGVLRLSPGAFWAMSPREFAGAIRPFTQEAGEPIGRGALEALMQRFPDGA